MRVVKFHSVSFRPAFFIVHAVVFQLANSLVYSVLGMVQKQHKIPAFVREGYDS
jgi:hypothetical protein